MRRAIETLASLSFLAASASAQVSDMYCGESHATPGVFDLITGQFSRHGRPWWQDRAWRREARLIRGLFDLETRIELAAACIELGEVGRARRILGIVESMSPGRPEVLYNLGACAKREATPGTLALATRAGADDRTEVAGVARRPGGRVLDRFLGVPYQDWPRCRSRGSRGVARADRPRSRILRRLPGSRR